MNFRGIKPLTTWNHRSLKPNSPLFQEQRGSASQFSLLFKKKNYMKLLLSLSPVALDFLSMGISPCFHQITRKDNAWWQEDIITTSWAWPGWQEVLPVMRTWSNCYALKSIKLVPFQDLIQGYWNKGYSPSLCHFPYILSNRLHLLLIFVLLNVLLTAQC